MAHAHKHLLYMFLLCMCSWTCTCILKVTVVHIQTSKTQPAVTSPQHKCILTHLVFNAGQGRLDFPMTSPSPFTHETVCACVCIVYCNLCIVWHCALSSACRSVNVFLCMCLAAVCAGNATGPYFPWAQGSAGFSLALSKQFRKNNDRPLYWLAWPGRLGVFTRARTHTLCHKKSSRNLVEQSLKPTCAVLTKLINTHILHETRNTPLFERSSFSVSSVLQFYHILDFLLLFTLNAYLLLLFCIKALIVP